MLRKVCDGQSLLVQLEDCRAIVAARDQIVEHNSVQHLVTADCDTVERLILNVRPLLVPVHLMLEVADREQLEPRPCVGFAVVNQLERRGDAATEPARRLVYHRHGMEEGIASTSTPGRPVFK